MLEFDNTSKTLGFRPLKTDPCVYSQEETKVRIVIYVDDGLVFGPTQAACRSVVQQLNQRFQVKKLSGNQFLGIQLERTGTGLRL